MKVKLSICCLVLFAAISCKKDKDPIVELQPPEYVSCSYEGETNIDAGDVTIEVIYNKTVSLLKPHNITLNDEDVTNAKAEYEKVFIDVTLEKATSYSLKIPAGIVKAYDGSTAEEVNISFSTKQPNDTKIDSTLVISNPSQQAINLYNFLKETYGKKVLSATMANVSWNINEAEWVKQHTDKYPAMVTFDYVHLLSSPANWIDYSQTAFIEDWWNSNGLIAAGWHWNVPTFEGSSKISFRTEETTFSTTNATIDGTWENNVVKADLEKLAGYLKLLQAKKIPVIWRPLHEAAGNIYEYNNGTAWFWWGANGADSYKKLWIYMFDYFETQGLNNLIWVWTTQTKDDAFYPGDEYVDIVGRDIYNESSSTEIATQFTTIQETYPNKMVTLSEFGNVANFTDQWNSDAKWSYFMPWYDYTRTKTLGDTEFNKTVHEHADIAWWNDVLSNTYVITRDQMPNLK